MSIIANRHDEVLLHGDYVKSGLMYVHPDGSPEVPAEVWVAFPPKPAEYDYGEHAIAYAVDEHEPSDDLAEEPGLGAQVLGWVRGLLNY